MLLVDAIRESCAHVAAAARFVRMDDDALARIAERLRPEDASPHADEPSPHGDRAGFALALNAINFGSGWWPTIRKRPGSTGYLTIATAFAEWWGDGRSAEELAALDARAVAEALGQDPGHELMALYAAHLADVGARVSSGYGDSFAAVVEAARRSAPRLVELLAAWPSFLDVSTYGGRPVPFFKRAQLAAAELAPDGVEALTLFADNLVPHVLRVDGALVYDDELAARIDGERLLEHGSTEEVEIRACAVEAVERIGRLCGAPPATVDRLLWNAGQDLRYKSRPRHRARSTAY